MAQNLLILHIFWHVSSHDCHSIRLRPRLGYFAPNGFLLASIPPHGDTFLSACSQCSCSFLEQNGLLALKQIIIYRTSRCYQIYMILFYSASRQYSVFFPLMVPSSLHHGDIEFSSAAVAFDWCFLPSRRYHTTDESDKNETPSLSSSSPVEILPASRCCPSTGIHSWILDLCPVCLQAGACLFLHHSWLLAPFDCCLSRVAISCHRAES